MPKDTYLRITMTLSALNGSPLLMERCAPDRIPILKQDPPKKTKDGKKRRYRKSDLKPSPDPTDIPPEEIARAKLYINETGHPVIPAINLLTCLREAGRHIKVKGIPLTRANGTSIVHKVITFNAEAFPLHNMLGDTPITVDVIQVDKRKGQSGPIARPVFDEWQFHVTMTVRTNALGGTLSKSLIRSLVATAGARIGIMAFRKIKGHSSPFGKFEITAWHAESCNGPTTSYTGPALPTVLTARGVANKFATH